MKEGQLHPNIPLIYILLSKLNTRKMCSRMNPHQEPGNFLWWGSTTVQTYNSSWIVQKMAKAFTSGFRFSTQWKPCDTMRSLYHEVYHEILIVTSEHMTIAFTIPTSPKVHPKFNYKNHWVLPKIFSETCDFHSHVVSPSPRYHVCDTVWNLFHLNFIFQIQISNLRRVNESSKIRVRKWIF